MKPRLEIGLESLPLDAIEADVVVAGFFAEDRPLRGGAGRVDWRLCGLVSEFLADERIVAERGSAFLVAATGAFAAPRILLLGLGSRSEFSLTVAQDLMRDATARCIALGVRRIALAPLGIASDDFARHAAPVVGGIAEALRSWDPPPSAVGLLEVRLSVPEPGIEQAGEALGLAVGAFEDEGITARPVERRHHRPSPLASPPRPASAHLRP